MNVDVQAKWVEALRSGRYRQGTGALAQPGRDGDEYCCLGVLCDLAAWDDVPVVTGTAYMDGVKVHTFNAELATLPTTVMRWAGLDSVNPQTNVPSSTGRGFTLAELNDAVRYSFDQIADVIERDL